MIWNSGNISGFQSKILLDLPHGSFKVIKIEPDSQYPVHKHPDRTEFVYVLEGPVLVTIADEEYMAQKDDFVELPNNVLHSLSNTSEQVVVILVGAIHNQD